MKKFLKIFPALSLPAPGEVGLELVTVVLVTVVLATVVLGIFALVTLVALLEPRDGFAGLNGTQHNLISRPQNEQIRGPTGLFNTEYFKINKWTTG